MKIITTILALAVLALPSCRHGRTGPQGEPGQNGIGQDGTDGLDGQDGTDGLDGTPADRIVVLTGIDGLFLPSPTSQGDTLPVDLDGLGDIAGEGGLLILTDAAIYVVRTRDGALVVLRSDEEGDIAPGEITNSPTCFEVGETSIFCDSEPDDEEDCDRHGKGPKKPKKDKKPKKSKK